MYSIQYSVCIFLIVFYYFLLIHLQDVSWNFSKYSKKLFKISGYLCSNNNDIIFNYTTFHEKLFSCTEINVWYYIGIS